MIQALEEIVSENIITEVKLAGFYTVMMDETTDTSGKEQASLILRFVDKEEKVQERLVSVSCVEKTDAETLFKLVMDTLHSKGLEVSQIRGQCYDGASNMSGKYNGVQARVKAVENRAVYIHCYAHCLNLVLVDTVKRNKNARNFFGIIQSLYCFVRNSTLRHSVFQSLQREVEKTSHSSEAHQLALKRVCETRWSCRFEAIRAVEANFSILLDLLETIENDPGSDAKAVTDARGLRIQMKTFEFVIALLVLKHLFEHTNITSQYLQSESIDLDAAIASVQATQSTLKKFRNDGTHFHRLFEAAERMCNHMGCDVPTLENMRRRKVSRRLDQMWENEHEFDSLEAKIKVEFFNEVLDCMIQQIDERFSQETQYLLQCFCILQPEKLMDRNSQHVEKLNHLGTFYRLDVASLQTQYTLFMEARRDRLEKCKSISDVLNLMKVTGLHRVYAELYELYRIFVTLPVTTASCERSFSKLTIVKNKLRSTMSQDRLQSLLILSVESDLTDKVPFEPVVERFALMRSRCMNLL